MSRPFFGRRFRTYQPLRPRTCTAQSRSNVQRLLYRQSVSLPVLTLEADVSDIDTDSDTVYSEIYDKHVSPRGNTKKSACTRLPDIKRDSHQNARASRQLVISQQKLMFKYQNLEHQFKKLKNKAALIKRELDRIRVMKTPEPEPNPTPSHGNHRNLWTFQDDSSCGSLSPRRISAASSVSLPSGSRPESHLTSTSSVHLGSSCIFRSESCFSRSTRSGTPDSSASSCTMSSTSIPQSSSTSVSADSSFLYSDTEDEG